MISAISFKFQQNKSYPNRPYISSRRGVETKLSKSQQIDTINVKNVQDMNHMPSP